MIPNTNTECLPSTMHMCSTTIAVPTSQVHYIRMFITHRAYYVFSVSIPIHKIQLREFMGVTIPVMKPLGYHFVPRMRGQDNLLEKEL